MSPGTVVALIELGADVLRSVIEVTQDSPSPSDYAKRLMSIAKDMVPTDELRAHLDALDADAADRRLDIAEEATIAVRKMGG